MARYGNENAAAGGRSSNTADRDRSYGGASDGRGRGTNGNDRAGLTTPKRAGSATVADKMIRDKYIADKRQNLTSDKGYWDAVGNLGRAYNDYNNVGQGFLDDPLGWAGRKLGGSFGIGEIDPTRQPLGNFSTKNTASWGVDPIGAMLGAAGMINPIGSLANYGYKGIKNVSGWDGPQIAFDGSQVGVGSPIGQGLGVLGGGGTPPKMAGLGNPNRNGGIGNPQIAQGGVPQRPVNRSMPQMAAPQQRQLPQSGYASGMFLSPGGSQNYGVMRPGYNFMQPPR